VIHIRYVGSKNKLSKDLLPIIQKYIDDNNIKKYLEPFVGGANLIDKIKCEKRIGCDIHKELIALLKYIQSGGSIPERIFEDEYNKVKDNRDQYPDWYVGLIGFCASFGAKFFGGYARDSRNDNSGKWSAGAIKNLIKQKDNIKDVYFLHMDFRKIPKDKITNYLIYCDPPYRNTTDYKTEKFPYEDFYKWVKEMSVNNIVLVSEYNMPEEFTCIWSKNFKTGLDIGKQQERVEKLFIYKSQ